MRIKTKTSFQTRFWLWLWAVTIGGSAAAIAVTNVAPTVVISDAVQRPGTTFMDIYYRVNDPDDTNVQTAALAFVNAGTDLSSVIKLNTLVEGTAANIGSNTPANTTLHLAWNVAADWNTNFGNVAVEILARDGRGLLPFHWITLPSNGPNPEITINRWPVYDADLLPLWYWLIATSDPAVQLVNGQILGVGGDYNSNVLAQGTSTIAVGREFLWQRFNIHSLSLGEVVRAEAGRYGFQSVDWYSIAKGFAPVAGVYGWGNNSSGQLNLPPFSTRLTAVALGNRFTLILAADGVAGWGNNDYGQITIPASATNVVAIAAGENHTLAVNFDGRVVGWGLNSYGQTTIPASATNVLAIAAGQYHSLALKADGTVIGWGGNAYGQTTSPAGATNVLAIAAGGIHSLALRADGTVVGWGFNGDGETAIPGDATNVVAIAAGLNHSLALKADGTVVGWGWNGYSQVTIPAGATNVLAIAAGDRHSLALKADGTVVVWGRNNYGQTNAPAGLSGIDVLGVGCTANHVVVVDKRTP